MSRFSHQPGLTTTRESRHRIVLGVDSLEEGGALLLAEMFDHHLIVREVADARGATAPLRTAQDAHRDCPALASTRLQFRPLPGGRSVIYLPDRRTTGVSSALSRTDGPTDRKCGRAHGEPCVGDRYLGLNPRPVLKLVDHVAVAAQRQSRVVTELTRDVDDASSLV